MTLNGQLEVFFGGALGWVLVELAKFGLAAVGDTPHVEVKYTTLIFWIGAFALLIVSGVCAVLNGVENVPLIKAVQYGINAPAIISGLATNSKLRRSRRSTLGMAPDYITHEENIFMRIFRSQSW